MTLGSLETMLDLAAEDLAHAEAELVAAQRGDDDAAIEAAELRVVDVEFHLEELRTAYARTR